ncbi:MAG: hypothetical protein K0S55_1857, partial [Clostridia bacterium]|nr:hypothetical protein [Clostridia bacterium]
MTDNTFEYLLIQHCSPTLAGIKTANLFSCNNSEIICNSNFLNEWNKILNQKDIYIIILYNYSKSSLLLVYRRSRLKIDLLKKDIRSFLKLRGYDNSNNSDDDIKHLKTRLEIYNKLFYNEFPHEIGLFLSY